MLEQLLSTCQIMYDQVEQIEDVKICKVNNVETKYYKVKWKCTWEPEPILEKICGNIINDYTRTTQSDKYQEEPKHRNEQSESNVTETLPNSFASSSFDVFKEEEGGETVSFTTIELNDIIKEESIENALSSSLPRNSQTNSSSNIVSYGIRNLPDNNLNIFNILNLTSENEGNIEKENCVKSVSLQDMQKCRHTLNTNDSILNNSLDSKEEISDNDRSFHPHLLITGRQDANQAEKAIVDDKEHTNNNVYYRKREGKRKSSNKMRKPSKEFCCNRCSFSSPYMRILRKHTRKHTREKPFKCGRCYFAAVKKQALKRHLAIHTGLKPWECDKCSFATSIKECLTDHISIHHNEEKEFKCQLCSFSTLYPCSLKRHMIRHTGEKPFKCDQCSYTATGKHLLNFHLAKHTGLKPFKCNLCDYASSMKGALTKHMRIHASKKQYKCDKCAYTACFYHNFKRHLLKHDGANLFRCSSTQILTTTQE